MSTSVLLSFQEIVDLVRNDEREDGDEEEADDAVDTVVIPSNINAITAFATLQSFFSAQDLTGGVYCAGCQLCPIFLYFPILPIFPIFPIFVLYFVKWSYIILYFPIGFSFRPCEM